MAFIIETGAGTPNANAYVSPAFVTTYLTDRNREKDNGWSTKSLVIQKEAIVVGTDYVEKKNRARFKSTSLVTHIAGRQARGSIVFGANPLTTETVTLGAKVYRFIAVLAQEDDVLIGATLTDSLANLAAAIGTGEVAGTNYDSLTRINFEAFGAEDEDTAGTFLMFARQNGENGNEIVLATTVTGATASGASFASGLDEGSQPLFFPVIPYRTNAGALISGVPVLLKQAVAEYSVRSLAALLAPDPTSDDSGSPIQSTRSKVGPIEDETVFIEGAQPRIFKSYPAADALLSTLVRAGGGVIR